MKAAGAEMSTRYIKVLDVLQCLFESIKQCVAWLICEKGGVGNHLLFPVVLNSVHPEGIAFSDMASFFYSCLQPPPRHFNGFVKFLLQQFAFWQFQ